MEALAIDNRRTTLCDMDYLLASLAGNRAMADKLAKLFLDTYPGQTQEMGQALERSDLAALRKVVHNIRGSCVLFSVGPGLALAGKLENSLPDQPGPDLTADCAQLRGILEDMAEELGRFLGRTDG